MTTLGSVRCFVFPGGVEVTDSRCHTRFTASMDRQLLLIAVAGDGRAKIEGWLPRYVRFPQAQYTGRPLTARSQVMA